MRQFVLREESQCRALYAYLRHNWPAMAAQGKPLAVTVAEHKDKRHAQQNRLYWALLKQVSEQAMVDGKRYSDEVWHEQFKRTLLGLVDLPGGAKAGESTTKLNVSEFAEYVTKVTAYAATELGVIFEGTAMEYLYFTDKAVSGGYIIRRRVISVSVTTDDYGSELVFVVSGLRRPEKIRRGKDGEYRCFDVFMSEKEAVEKAASLRRRRIEYHKRALGRLLAMKDDSIIDLSED